MIKLFLKDCTIFGLKRYRVWTFKQVWSDTLAKEADAWISRCNFEHENKGRGENLAFNTAKDDEANIAQAIQDWYDEIKMYNYAGKACGMSCHYTQVNFIFIIY